MVEGLSASVSKGRSLTFEVQGDGNLPRITVLKPITTNMKGVPAIVFSKYALLFTSTQIIEEQSSRHYVLRTDLLSKY